MRMPLKTPQRTRLKKNSEKLTIKKKNTQGLLEKSNNGGRNTFLLHQRKHIIRAVGISWTRQNAPSVCTADFNLANQIQS